MNLFSEVSTPFESFQLHEQVFPYPKFSQAWLLLVKLHADRFFRNFGAVRGSLQTATRTTLSVFWYYAQAREKGCSVSEF